MLSYQTIITVDGYDKNGKYVVITSFSLFEISKHQDDKLKNGICSSILGENNRWIAHKKVDKFHDKEIHICTLFNKNTCNIFQPWDSQTQALRHKKMLSKQNDRLVFLFIFWMSTDVSLFWSFDE